MQAEGQNGSAGTERNQFGAFGGVFTPCLLTILGVILFMRSNFVVGQAGILGALIILAMAKAITLLTALSTSAICTNMQVRGGGAYYLISRVLGPEFGGAIGVVLFLAQAVSIPFYILGFTEALVLTFPSFEPYFAAIAFGTAGLLFVVTYVGASWAIRIQFVIMAVLIAAIVVFLGGAATHFSPETFSANLHSAFTSTDPSAGDAPPFTFWVVFAIYFPAVTGIMAGINMSGDLKDPVRGIPRGTLAAIGGGAAVYIAAILICGGAFDRSALVERPYLLLKENALFGLSFLVAAGMLVATLSSALGSFMGAPRVLQAVGRDRIVPILHPFARGSRKGDEPRRALVVAGALTFGVLLWACLLSRGNALNLVAGIITEFFLYTYGMLNAAAFIEAVTRNPSFRPRFRLFHWSTALAGAVGCMAVALIISPAQSAIAIALLTGLVLYLRRQNMRVAFGDARRGFVFNAIRNGLLTLSRMEESPKNWRPTVLVLSGNPELREELVSFAVWFEAGRGIVFLANILVGTFDERGRYRGAAEGQLRQFCLERDIDALPVVLVDESLEHGIGSLLQTLSVGTIRPNLTMFGWSRQTDRIAQTVRHFRLAQSMGMALAILDSGDKPIYVGHRFFKFARKRIDVWWRGRKNGQLMLLLAHLVTRNWEWSDTEVRLLRVIDEPAGREGSLADLEQLIATARVDATAEVIVSDKSFDHVLHEHSAGADCVFLGFELPEPGDEASWYERYNALLEGPLATILVCAVGDEGLMA